MDEWFSARGRGTAQEAPPPPPPENVARLGYEEKTGGAAMEKVSTWTVNAGMAALESVLTRHEACERVHAHEGSCKLRSARAGRGKADAYAFETKRGAMRSVATQCLQRYILARAGWS